MSIQKLHYENLSGMLIRRGGFLNWRCPLCKAKGQSPEVMRTCPECGSKEAPFPVAQPTSSLASSDVSLISKCKTQPAQSVKDAIIDDLQSQFDTEGITEHDSGDALIRLSDAIAAVEDNFAQPAPSIPEGWQLVPIEPTEKMINEGTCASTLPGPHYIDSACAKQCWVNMLAAAPKPAPSALDATVLLRRAALALEVIGTEWRESDPTLRLDLASALATASEAKS